jgi:hypothetical protein
MISTKNCETLVKEIEEDKKNGMISHVHELEELILLKYSYTPRQNTDTIPIKMPMTFFTERKEFLKFV